MLTPHRLMLRYSWRWLSLVEVKSLPEIKPWPRWETVWPSWQNQARERNWKLWKRKRAWARSRLWRRNILNFPSRVGIGSVLFGSGSGWEKKPGSGLFLLVGSWSGQYQTGSATLALGVVTLHTKITAKLGCVPFPWLKWIIAAGRAKTYFFLLVRHNLTGLF